eukprot:1910595-Alexandrium_andersonii.AAC.1
MAVSLWGPLEPLDGTPKVIANIISTGSLAPAGRSPPAVSGGPLLSGSGLAAWQVGYGREAG